MSLALGAALGLGVVLVLAPWFWPTRAPREGRRTVSDRVGDELVLAGLGRVPLAVVIVVCFVLGIALAGVAQAVFGVAVLTVIAGIVGLLLVPLLVRTRADRRRVANRTVWPDVVDHLVSSVRAGMSLPDSLSALADLGPSATRPAFASFADAYRRTGNFAVCLDALKALFADPVADRILETLRMAREVGGSDVTSVLRGLATYLREDAALRAEVVSRQSWIRNAARLGVAAPWLLLVVLATRSETLDAYNSPAGAALLVFGVGVSLVAYRVMVSLGRLPQERRWLR